METVHYNYTAELPRLCDIMYKDYNYQNAPGKCPAMARERMQ